MIEIVAFFEGLALARRCLELQRDRDRLLARIDELETLTRTLAERCAAQSELLSRNAQRKD